MNTKNFKSLLIALILVTFHAAQAKEYAVNNGEEMKSLKLLPGDKVVMRASGNWKNQQITFKAKGTADQPITLTTEQPGSIISSGNSTLKIDGEYLVVDGLAFADGYSEKDAVVTFSKNSKYCRLTNSSIINYNHPEKTFDYKWISMYGSHNRVDHCELTGKTHQGTTLVVWLSEEPNYSEIDHNYFGPRPDLGVNGGETIRIGTSEWSMHNSFTKVTNNIFDRCNGEMEIISVKSGKNLIANNLFYECVGTMTLRHGNGTEVANNFFIGNDVKNTGGIRVIGEAHNIHDNYLQGLAGTGLRAAISVMDAYENPELFQYFQVKNTAIKNNMIVNCREALNIGSGKDLKRTVAPEGLSITDNVIVNSKKTVVFSDQAQNSSIKNNTVIGSEQAEGFSAANVRPSKTLDNLTQISKEALKPFWFSERIGPLWKKEKLSFLIK